MPIFWRDQMLEWYFQAKLIGIVIWGGAVLIMALIYQLWKMLR